PLVIYALSLHDALPICALGLRRRRLGGLGEIASTAASTFRTTFGSMAAPSDVDWASWNNAEHRGRNEATGSTDSENVSMYSTARSEEHTSELQSLRHLV